MLPTTARMNPSSTSDRQAFSQFPASFRGFTSILRLHILYFYLISSHCMAFIVGFTFTFCL